MATFKVGQRVRVKQIWDTHIWPQLVGKEGVVVTAGSPAWEYIVDIPGCPHISDLLPPTHYGFDGYELEPLTPPDTWALEAVRKVTTPNRQIAYDAIREEAKRELQETLREQSR